MKLKVGIIGNGWVGKAQKEMFPDAYVYTRKIGNKEEINKCDVVFVAIPTPNARTTRDGTISYEHKLDTSEIEKIIKWLKVPLIVIRSTVNVGDCDRWTNMYRKNIVFQPEYLGETPSHPLLDTKAQDFIIMGGRTIMQMRRLINLYQEVYNANIKIRQVDLRTAEAIKLTENRAIALKVAECQELYDVCQRARIDYTEVIQAVYGDDPRFNLWFTFVYPEKRGFKSKCIPKDVYAWCAWAESLGYNPKVTRAILEKNKEYIK